MYKHRERRRVCGPNVPPSLLPSHTAAAAPPPPHTAFENVSARGGEHPPRPKTDRTPPHVCERWDPIHGENKTEHKKALGREGPSSGPRTQG